ncbi:YczE/YyaS/YitT family protein [Lysinibacillus odysseyi]|uniref:Membrane protein n=1 Tax=Lysinibacillus odysseyi 34hs-1 = NBRC 100172 TaxID=1220589 RepID=A0A0A3IB57_9BACI|nr:YitT family protein [Lysinibacillus odysseyi]KGR81954.1 membrane protein [Lysinibacillus odysseyi 34hs-1 = NBRC 100172]
MNKLIYWRSAFFLLGIIVLSFGVTLTVKAKLIGVGSWDVLHIGLADTAGLTIGSWSIIAGLLILAIDSIVMKRFPKMGTFLDMFLTGIFIDIFNSLLPDVVGFFPQLIAFCFGLVFLGFGSGMYIVANLGVGPRDTLMLLVTNKLGWSVRRARTTLEITVAVLGFCLGGPIGIGTVIMSFGLGPIVQWALLVNEKMFSIATGTESSVYS